MTGLLPRRATSMSGRSFKMGPLYLAISRGLSRWLWTQLGYMGPLKIVLALPLLVAVAVLVAIIMLFLLLVFFLLWLTWAVFRPLRRSYPDELQEDGWEWRE